MKGNTQRVVDPVSKERDAGKRRRGTTKKTRLPREAKTAEQPFKFQRSSSAPELYSEFFLVAVMQRFLWWCAGFDPRILRLNECASVRAVYSTMGAAVLVTAGFALCSSLYFFSTVLDPARARTFAGLWALFIFLTDRYIVSSTRKRAVPAPRKPGGQQLNLFRTSFPFANALLRLLLGAMVSLVIAAPLEVALQKGRIATARMEERNEMSAALTLKAEKAIHAATAALTTQYVELQHELTGLRAAWTKATVEAHAEADCTGGTHTCGAGPVYDIKHEEEERAAKEYADTEKRLGPRIDDIQKQIAATRAAIARKYDEQITQSERDHSFSADWEALDALRAKSPAINLMSWGLSLVFLVLELCPVLAKLFAPFDVYDSFLLIREGAPQILNVTELDDLRLKWQLWTELREVRAACVKRLMVALCQEPPRADGWRVVGDRASREFRDVASDAMRSRRPPVWSVVYPAKAPAIVVLARGGRERIMSAFHRAGEFLKNSLSLVEALRWVARKLFPQLLN